MSGADARRRRRLTELARELAAPGQAPARNLGQELSRELELAQRAFSLLTPRLCPGCVEDCCRRVSRRGVMDQADLLNLALMGFTDLPPAQGGGCPWHGERGCRLDWRARPFACLHYICPPLAEALPPAGLERVRAALARAGALRSRLMAAYLAARIA